MNRSKFLFSVVMPVYKVEAYIAEAVDSVINQTIGFEKNIEIILVNDGSPDNSGKICEKYRDMYPENIRYIEKENGGVSSARNVGIEYATGEIVNFLDSDDKWAVDAFQKAYDFYQQYGEEIDVIAGRLQLFEATTGWHLLDYKYKKGTRVADLTDKKEANSVFLHITSAFIRRKALKDYRFNEKVKFSEDTLFLTTVILDKLKYGIIDDCVCMYRKRADDSSATQGRLTNVHYYTLSPRLYYNGIVEESKKRYGEVVPYVQNVLAYDIGLRVRDVVPEEIKSNKEIFEPYMVFLREILENVEDEFYLRSPVHKRLGIKCAFYRLKHNGKELIEKSRFDLEKKSVYVDDVRLYNFNKINHAGCIIHICEAEGDTFTVEGLVSRWLLSSCPESELSLVFKAGDKVYRPVISSYRHALEKSIFGLQERYCMFRQKIELSGLARGGELKIKAALTVGDELCDITVRYGMFVPDASEFDHCFKVIGDYIVSCRADGITVKRSKNIKKEVKIRQKSLMSGLEQKGLNEAAEFRKSVLEMRKKQFKHKKLWLITDRYDKAEDNGEALFRYLSAGKGVNRRIVPVFAISKEYDRIDELRKIGKVIHLEDEEEYKKYFLCADKILASSGVDFSVNPFSKEELAYITDLIDYKIVFLQHGITKDDLSGWLNKFNKNISLFITAAKNERASIINGDYMYTEKQVKLTGFARYDLLEDRREKIVAVMPTWRKAIKGSYDANTASVYYNKFKQTEYFKFYNELINDERLLAVMREKGYRGIFCLHPIHSKQSVDYIANDVFEVNEGFVNYKDIFSQGALLVTDYSSVFFDFAYLKKPVVYSQFDRESFFDSHSYDEGYFNYENDGFGTVCYDLDSTVEAIIASLERDCRLEDKYLERIESFYGFNDKSNCKRIYKEIIKMD